MTDAGCGSSHRCRIMSQSSKAVMILTMTHAEIYGLRIWIVGGVWVWKGRYGGWEHFWMFSCFSLLCFASRPGINSIVTGFTTSRFQSMRGGGFLSTRSAERSPLSCTDRLWDIWVHMIAYVERLFDCFLFISFLSFSCTGLCSPGGLHLKRRIM